MFIPSDTVIFMFMTKIILLRFECGSVTRTALENSENYYGFTSGSVDGVCLPAPNVDKRGSKLDLFLQRLDHRLHFTQRVYCQGVGLRVTTCPLFCRNFDVVRLLRRKSVATTACDLRETMRARTFPRAMDWIRHAFPRRRSCQDPCVCPFALSKKNGGIFLLRATDMSRLFTGPCGHCRSQHMPTCDVRAR